MLLPSPKASTWTWIYSCEGMEQENGCESSSCFPNPCLLEAQLRVQHQQTKMLLMAPAFWGSSPQPGETCGAVAVFSVLYRGFVFIPAWKSMQCRAGGGWLLKWHKWWYQTRWEKQTEQNKHVNLIKHLRDSIFFSRACCSRTRGFKLTEDWFRLGIRKNVLTNRVVEHQNNLVIHSLSLEPFKTRLNGTWGISNGIWGAWPAWRCPCSLLGLGLDDLEMSLPKQSIQFLYCPFLKWTVKGVVNYWEMPVLEGADETVPGNQ